MTPLKQSIEECFGKVPSQYASEINYGIYHCLECCFIDLANLACAETSPIELASKRIASIVDSRNSKKPIVWSHLCPPNSERNQLNFSSSILRLFVDENCGIGKIYSTLASCSGQTRTVGILNGRINQSRVLPFSQCDHCIFVDGSTAAMGNGEIVSTLAEKNSPETSDNSVFHSTESGLADLVVPDIRQGLVAARQFLRATEAVDRTDIQTEVSPEELSIPEEPTVCFDMRIALRSIVDDGSYLEVRADFAPEIVTAYASICGIPFSIIANNSMFNGGMILPRSARKIARQISLANSYRMPILFCVDTGGFMVGEKAEKDGALNSAGALFDSLQRCQSPILQVVLRRGYSAGLYAMGGPGFGTDFYCLANADIGIMGDYMAGKLDIDNSTLKLNIDSMGFGPYRVIEPSEVRSCVGRFLSNVIPTEAKERTFIFPR